jgi:excisionase family DNA binding protein
VVITATEEFLSPEEVGDRLGVSVYTVRRWIKTGRLRAFKPGKEYRIQESDLEEFLRAREVRPKAPSRSPLEPSLLNGLEEERRAAWDAAARNARQLREHGEDRMEALLSSWRDSRDRRALREMGLLFNEAEAARNALMDNIEAGLAAGDREAANLIAAGAKEVPNPGWEEVLAAVRFYQSLFDMAEKAGLRVRRERKPDREVHEVEEAA